MVKYTGREPIGFERKPHSPIGAYVANLDDPLAEEPMSLCIDGAELKSMQAACGVSVRVLIERTLKIAHGLDAIEIDQEGIHCI